MIVVADSTPLHYLILIDQVSLLPAFYDQVFIPEEVFRELSIVAAPPEVSQWLSNLPLWLHRVYVSEEEIGVISNELDLGEREAIALAERLRADLLLVDDLAARTEASRRNLRVTGTLGVLRVAAERGIIDVPHVLGRLRETNFYFDENLLSAVFGPWLSI